MKTTRKNLILEMRASQTENNQNLTVEGYAAVFDDPTFLYEIGDYKCYEVIESGALNDVLNNDVIFRYNHGDSALVLARSSNGTLRMSLDDKGLKIEADIINNTIGNDVYKLIERGDLNKMSFAFVPSKERFEQDTDNKTYTRYISKVDTLLDVAVVDFPAYENTNINTRSADAEEFEKEIKKEINGKLREKLILLTYL